ncbi:amidohydrolase family protein [Colwellia sp. PAMC 21821]|uniref:amidohydrolase family protein n=1 Tax=Colwellia sp. PAMC 21821 TaxID=1816219 RepID=UPI0009BF5F93|nr:amidohydrolase family protein [Colwellia sp. PAMC 21821]ARD45031.1 amidohydrolase [Colwellia sp. PAMC 21821]
MKHFKVFKSSLIALALASSSASFAQSFAITNATVHTVTEQGVLENATVVVEDGKVIAINPETLSAEIIIDAKGRILTPGLIGSMNQLGLVEVGAVSKSRDAGDKKADITFDASLAFNPRSSVIPYSRKGGITSNVVSPHGGEDMFKGQTFVADLSGEFDSVRASSNSVVIDLGAKSKGSRALSLQNLQFKLEDTVKELAKAKNKTNDAKDKKEAKEPSREAQVINALLTGEKALVAHADRATDLLFLLKLKKQFSLDLVFVGAADAVLIADKIAEAKVPVVMAALDNLPGSFDSLHASLENAAKLAKAGVIVALTVNGDTHNLYQLRFHAGNAIANGLSPDAALASVTANVAQAFNLDSGTIAVGKTADLVLWSADPFELSTKVSQMWINGKEYSTRSRQDALRDRYTTSSDMPKAYVK